MNIRFDERLKKELGEIKQKNPKLFKRINKQLNLFKLNPKHNSLRVHKLAGDLENMRSISINKSLRMSYLQDGDEAYFFDVGTHDEVYGKSKS